MCVDADTILSDLGVLFKKSSLLKKVLRLGCSDSEGRHQQIEVPQMHEAHLYVHRVWTSRHSTSSHMTSAPWANNGVHDRFRMGPASRFIVHLVY